MPGRGWGISVLVVAIYLAASCATMEAPGGGPEDKTPPELVLTMPDSGSVGLASVDRLVFEFSEKVQPVPAERLLRFYPDLEVRSSHWKGRRRLTVELVEPLPADTVIVVELTAGYSDMHRVQAPTTRIVVLATANTLPEGRLRALVLLDGQPSPKAVAELHPVPHDSVTWSYGAWVPQNPLRRAVADSTGWFSLDWLPVPGGPWLLRLFADNNGDLRPQENEAQRLWPQTWSLSEDHVQPTLDAFELYAPSTPGSLVAVSLDSTWNAPVHGWTEKIADTDTGLVYEHRLRPDKGQIPVSRSDRTIWEGAGPDLCRLVLFADLDGDSLLSALPDSSAVDTVAWWWEPHALVDSVTVEPGRPRSIQLPAMPTDRKPAWEPPSPALMLPDSTLTAAVSDSLPEPEAEQAEEP